MTDYIRVRDKSTGHEYTIPATRLVDGLTVIDKPALDRSGDPAPVKYRTRLGEPIPGGKTARKRAAQKKTTAAKRSTADENDGRSVAPEKEN